MGHSNWDLILDLCTQTPLDQTPSPSRLKLNYQIDPVSELADPRVHSWLVGLCASDAPGYDAGEDEPLVGPLDDHGAPRVPFARVEPSPSPSCADEDVGDVFDVAGHPVHGLAHGVVDDRYGDLLEDAGERTVWKVDF